jgi:broad specificity phosphatase PhoE
MSTPPLTLYLARHGQSQTNHQGLVTGQLDVGLSDKGLQQSQALAECLRDVPLAAVYTSTLQRTLATAAPTAQAQGLTIERLGALDEIHMGELQGRFRDERDAPAQALWAQWQADPWGYTVPGGESMAAFTRRVEGALEHLLQRHRGQTILVVGHRATNRVILGTLLGWPRERWAEIRLRNKFFYRVQPGAAVPVATIALSGSKAGQVVDDFVM